MSNKTQLQTNNTALDALIARVNTAKDTAASLPEAGSGGGGGVEMCTVTIEVNAPVIDDYTVYSSNSNLQVVTTTVSSGGGTFQAAKGTIVMVTPWEGMSSDDNQIFKTSFNGGCGVWIITENCTIAYSG